MKTETLTWIDQQKPDLVARAEKYLDEHKIYQPKYCDPEWQKKKGAPPKKPSCLQDLPEEAKKPIISNNQLRNLLNAAQAGNPISVQVNFLRFQIGRQKNAWPDANSGEALITLLENLRTSSKKAVLGSEVAPISLEAPLAANLLGFIIREHTYRTKVALEQLDQRLRQSQKPKEARP